MNIYINTNEIESIKKRYNNYLNILNENANKIISYNEYLNNKSFIIYSLSFNKYRNEIYKILRDILKRETKFYSTSTLNSFFKETEKRLLYNEYKIVDSVAYIEDYNKQKLNIKQLILTENEIEQIETIFEYDEKTHVFSINENELQKELGKHIFNTSNKKQEMILKKIMEFNKICRDLFDVGIVAYNYINPNKDIDEIPMSEELAKNILRIE